MICTPKVRQAFGVHITYNISLIKSKQPCIEVRIYTRLGLHIVERLCKLALFVGSSVLVDNSTGSSLINLLNSSLVGLLREGSIT